MSEVEVKKTNKFVYNLTNFFKKYGLNALIAFGAVVLTSVLGSLFVDSNSNWFLNLAKPTFYPPASLFGIAWGIIYFLIALGLTSVLTNTPSKKLNYLYAINFVLQILWNYLFFRANNLFLSVIVMVVLIVFAYVLLKELYDDNKFAFYVTIPYFLWLLFAFLLNYSIYFLN